MQATALVFGISRPLNYSFDEVVRQRECQVLRIAFRMLGNWADAEDVAQEAFLRLHRHGLKFETDIALGAWLYRVTLNLCVDRVRALRVSGELPDVASAEPSAETVILGDERKRRLTNALATLPVKERAAITLREIEGLSTYEVAMILGSSETTVRSQICTAMAKLKALMNRSPL